MDWLRRRQDSSQYSSLKQINKTNVNRLEIVWAYNIGGGALRADGFVFLQFGFIISA